MLITQWLEGGFNGEKIYFGVDTYIIPRNYF